MRNAIAIAVLMLCIGGLLGPPRAEAQTYIKPIDGYVSGFGGYSFPQKTDIESGGIIATDAELDNSPSYGGKVGIWFTGARQKLGIDVGLEGDVTSFN